MFVSNVLSANEALESQVKQLETTVANLSSENSSLVKENAALVEEKANRIAEVRQSVSFYQCLLEDSPYTTNTLTGCEILLCLRGM